MGSAYNPRHARPRRVMPRSRTLDALSVGRYEQDNEYLESWCFKQCFPSGESHMAEALEAKFGKEQATSEDGDEEGLGDPLAPATHHHHHHHGVANKSATPHVKGEATLLAHRGTPPRETYRSLASGPHRR